jgi:hypothetical protein
VAEHTVYSYYERKKRPCCSDDRLGWPIRYGGTSSTVVLLFFFMIIIV